MISVDGWHPVGGCKGIWLQRIKHSAGLAPIAKVDSDGREGNLEALSAVELHRAGTLDRSIFLKFRQYGVGNGLIGLHHRDRLGSSLLPPE